MTYTTSHSPLNMKDLHDTGVDRTVVVTYIVGCIRMEVAPTAADSNVVASWGRGRLTVERNHAHSIIRTMNLHNQS